VSCYVSLVCLLVSCLCLRSTFLIYQSQLATCICIFTIRVLPVLLVTQNCLPSNKASNSYFSFSKLSGLFNILPLNTIPRYVQHCLVSEVNFKPNRNPKFMARQEYIQYMTYWRNIEIQNWYKQQVKEQMMTEVFKYLFPENWFCLTSISLLFAIVPSPSLWCSPFLGLLVLSYLV